MPTLTKLPPSHQHHTAAQSVAYWAAKATDARREALRAITWQAKCESEFRKAQQRLVRAQAAGSVANPTGTPQ